MAVLHTKSLDQATAASGNPCKHGPNVGPWLQAEVPKCADLRPVLALKPASAPLRWPNSRLGEHDLSEGNHVPTPLPLPVPTRVDRHTLIIARLRLGKRARTIMFMEGSVLLKRVGQVAGGTAIYVVTAWSAVNDGKSLHVPASGDFREPVIFTRAPANTANGRTTHQIARSGYRSKW